MEFDPVDIAGRFAKFSDEELRRRWTAGHLTTTAQSVAAAEARLRGLHLEPYQSKDEPHEEIPAPVESEEEYLGDWLLLARNLTPTQAHILSGFLSAHGIPVTAADTNTVQANSLWQQAVGGASIRVPRSLLQQASSLLAERRRGDFALDEGFDPGEPSPP